MVESQLELFMDALGEPECTKLKGMGYLFSNKGGIG